VIQASLDSEIEDFMAMRPDLTADPYPLFKRLRDEAPAYRYRAEILITRYEDVSHVLLDPDVFASGFAGSTRLEKFLSDASPADAAKIRTIFEFHDRWMTLTNGSKHTYLRGLAYPEFTPKAVQSMRRRIWEIVDEVVERVVARGEMEVIGDLAYQLPLTVITEMLGVPARDRMPIRRWSDAIAAFNGGVNMAELDRAYDSIERLKARLAEIGDEARAGQATDLMAAFLAAHGDDHGDSAFDTEHLVAMMAQLVYAGHETTTNLIGNGLLALLRHPDQWAAVCANPALIEDSVDELLRYDGPVQRAWRSATRPAVVAGEAVEPPQTITLILAAGNRDERVFERPDVLDLGRRPNRHLSLGAGTHYCLGGPLNRLETGAVIAYLAARFPDLTLAGGETKWQSNNGMRGLRRLPVRLGRDRGRPSL
jgi:cytochrome P450